MRILRLKVKNFKILEDFEIYFKDNISVFIGENGSGKSTILECLLLIFRKAHLQFVEKKIETENDRNVDDEELNGRIAKPLFVEVEYDIKLSYFDAVELRNKHDFIKIKLNNNNNNIYEIDTISEGYNIEDLIAEHGYEKLLPSKIIAYYAGWQETVKTYSERHSEIYEQKLLNLSNSIENASNPHLYINYINQQYFDIIMACFVAYDKNDNVDRFFDEELGITISENKSVIIIKLNKGKLIGQDAEGFWNAKGEQESFLKILEECKKHKNLYKDTIRYYFRKVDWFEVKNKVGGETELFNNLIALQTINSLEYISTTYEKIKNGETYKVPHQRFLSEGEQQRITIMGIHEFMADENALVLLDEPDVFLHPRWQRDFIYNLSKDESDLNHYFITTHSPNILSGLKKNQVFGLRKTENSTEIKDIHFNSFGKPVDMILTDSFAVESLRYKPVQEQIDKVWELIKSNSYKSKIFQDEFEELKSMIGKSDSEIAIINLELLRREKRNAKN